MIDWKYIFLIIFSHSFVNFVISSEIDLSKPLSVEECVDIALKNAPEIARGKNNISSAVAEEGRAIAGYLPQITATGGYSKVGPVKNPYYFSSRGELLTYKGVTYTGSLSLSQDIFDFTSLMRIKQAKAGKDVSAKSYKASIELVIFRVKQAYYNFLKAKMAVEAVEAEVLQSEEQEKRVSEMRRVGSATQADLLKVKVRLSQSKMSLLEVKNNVDVARGNLCLAMGIPPETELDIKRVSFDKPNVLPLEFYMEKAKRERPEIASSKASLEASRAGVWAARGGYMPRVTASGGYNWTDPSFPDSWSDIRDKYGWRIGMNVSISIFDGFLTRTNIKEANSKVFLSRALLSEAERQVEFEVRQAWLETKRLLEKSSLAVEAREQQEEEYRLTLERHRLGIASTLDLLTSQVSLTQARVEEGTTLCDLKIAEASLEKAGGVK